MNVMMCMTGEPEELPFLPEIAGLGAGIELGSYGLVGISLTSIGKRVWHCTRRSAPGSKARLPSMARSSAWSMAISTTLSETP